MNEYCDVCNQEHGPHYICEHYSKERKEKIKQSADQFRRNLYDPKWIEAQNVSQDVIDIYRIFAGGSND